MLRFYIARAINRKCTDLERRKLYLGSLDLLTGQIDIIYGLRDTCALIASVSLSLQNKVISHSLNDFILSGIFAIFVPRLRYYLDSL